MSGEDQDRTLQSRVVIAAHGSWETGSLPTHAAGRGVLGRDILAFKARFSDGSLSPGLMSLLAFPGGYGGLVHSDQGQISLSCCVTRSRLHELRAKQPGARAGDAVLAHILKHCEGAADVLGDAKQHSRWLASGPLRPGCRKLYRDGLFTVGNCAAEAQPVIAEGISMAIQGAHLLAQRLLSRGRSLPLHALDSIGHEYTRAWRRQFTMRLRSASLYAQLAMHAPSANAAAVLLTRYPLLLTWAARASGKSAPIDVDHDAFNSSAAD